MAAKNLERRRAARAHLVDYAQFVDVPGRPLKADDPDTEVFLPIESKLAAHHILLCNELERVSRTAHGRLMVFMPPGSAKSTYASVVFPSWLLGMNPGMRLILASYGDDLAGKMGRRTRSIIRQQRYERVCNTGLLPSSTAAQNFMLRNGSEYMACGLFSGITGNRAGGILIDDPVKGREAADSQTMRDKTHDAYRDDLLSRLIPGGWVVIIVTRWHEDDLAGRTLPDGWKGESGDFLCKDGMTWRVLSLQAKCETDSDPLGRHPGEYLWPEWFDRTHWAQFELTPRTWNSLYQQRPAPLDGDFFRPHMMPIVEAIPAGTKLVRSWDLASVRDGGDWTVGSLVGQVTSDRWIIADVVRLQGSPDDVTAAIVNTAARDGKSVAVDLPQDPGQAGKSQVAFLTGKLAGYVVRSSPESGDKVTRAEPLASQVNVGNVALLKAGWNAALIDEMKMFPNGSYDDQIDACSRGFNAKRLMPGKVVPLRI